MKKQLSFLSLVSLAFLVACNNQASTGNTTEEKKDTMKPTITEQPYGQIDQQPITQYTIRNAAGLQVSIINYGGTVTELIVPDKNGATGNVILGYDSLSGYLQKGNPYFNALIGRYGNRIAAGKFTLDGKQYTLAGNDHGNSLHGGNKGYDKVIWTAEKLPGDSAIQLSYLSKDGEEGYPGNLSIQVVYTLMANALRINYSATTDKATPVNLTSHCYFNLSAGRDSTVLDHILQIDADKFTEVNDQLIPTGELKAVKGGPMDFTMGKPIGRDIARVKGGYDHNWVLNNNNTLEKVATLTEPVSGRVMQVWTTEPGLQFYSGNFLDGSLTNTRGGAKYVKHAALCLETQHFPDSPNQPSFPNTILKPGETYRQTTVYLFSTK